LRGKSRRLYFFLSIVLATFALAACQEQINYPLPVASSLSPSQIQAGEPSFTLTVVGGNFTPASTIEWNGSARVTLFKDTAHLTAQILAGDIENAGQAQIVVSTPQPGGGVSQPALVFTVNPAPSPAPQISSLSPSSVLAGSGGFILVITGTNFFSQSAVSVGTADRSSTFINSTTLEVGIRSSDIASAGFVPLMVTNPPPNGGSSSVVNLTVTNTVPSIASISPTSLQAGAANTALTVSGTGFVQNSQVLLNGAAQTTSFSSGTSLEITLTPAQTTQGGLVSVQVSNPTPGGGVSNEIALGIDPTDTAGLPTLVDTAPDGTQANNAICGTCQNSTPSLQTAGPSVSQTGQFIAFASNSTNLLSLTTPSNGLSEVYDRNTCLGATTCIPATFLVSGGIGGAAPNGPSTEPSIDSSGGQAAFTSTATNLVNYVPVIGSNRQVYWAVTCTATAGCSSTTTLTTVNMALVSISADGTTAGNGDSYNPSISSDGQYVAFVSLATNLVSGATVDGITPQVYLRNTCNGVTPQNQVASGCIPTTYLVSSVDGITPGNGVSQNSAVATSGAYVSFVSKATNLGATAPNPTAAEEVFEQKECLSAAGCTLVTSLVSTPDGTSPANSASTEDAISPDGRFVAFASAATNLGIQANGIQQIFVRDTCNGATAITGITCSPSTILVSSPDVSASPSTPGNALSESPNISACSTLTTTTTACTSGEIIAFASLATNLGTSGQNGIENIFVRNTCLDLATTTTGCTPRTALASQPQGTGVSPANGSSTAPYVTADGHAVAFISSATNLVSGDNNGLPDIFLAATSF
jgi:trimeric autotransporter adhesin